jgi:hypothetical protein
MEEPRETFPPRLVIGFVVLALGALLALDSLGILTFNIRWHDYWPVILIVIGLTKVLARRTYHRTGGFVLLFLGCWFLARNLLDYDLDLRDAAIAEGQEALIDAVACWGGVLLLVPESWGGVLHGMPILGGFQDHTRPPSGGATQRLVVRGVSFMGGVEVRNEPERKDFR